jgi:hypothetical protein
MWRQFYNMVRVGAQGIYISMFDEYNEGNQIAKTAETAAMVPAGSGLWALNEDGTACSSDYYLRLTADGGRMLKKQIALTPTRPTPTVITATNLALGKTMAASGAQSGYPASNVNDNNTGSYWESTNNSFPQWLQVNLGSPTTVSKITLALPPVSSWSARTQTLSVLGSSDGTNFTTIVASAGYRFDPATGNTVTITFPATAVRYLRLNFTANTGWPAGQLSEFQIFNG